MAKDPAVLFYTNDFLSGTFTMSDEQVGKYIRLLCLQHQKNELTEKDMLNICKTYDEDIYSKFIKENGKYYNQRMRDEAQRRRRYSESRKNNRISTKSQKNDKSYDNHMETETEIETENINENGIDYEIWLNSWNAFAEMTGLVKIKKLTDKRKVGIKNRVHDKDFNLDEVFEKIRTSDFLLGKAGNGWKVDFDFVFCSKDGYIKILEGKYNGKIAGKRSPNFVTTAEVQSELTEAFNQFRNRKEILFIGSGLYK